MLQRLESVVIHWTRQVKEVVHTREDLSGAGGDAGPMSEIEFWRARSIDLGGIRAQVAAPAVEKIVEILAVAKSVYLAPFRDLSDVINAEAVAAEDNVKFLSTLEGPIRALESASASELAGVLPGILHRVRLIWNTATHYNVPERLVGLLRKVTNAIINRCIAEIKMDDILHGNDIDGAVASLKDSIAAGGAWKRAFENTKEKVNARHEDNPSMQWTFDTISLFAHLDAFVGRCEDLLEVCEAQVQFAPKKALPVFGGTKGPEVSKSFADIQDAFAVKVHGLRTLDYKILDVKATRWHDDYNAFKSSVKDLEVMTQNVMVTAIDAVSDLNGLVELLRALQTMAKRDGVTRCVERKCVECYEAFTKELNTVKKHFDMNREKPPIAEGQPKYSGAAMWAKVQHNRLKGPYEKLEEAAMTLPQTPELEQLRASYALALPQIQKYMADVHGEWVTHFEGKVEAQIKQRLENRLLSSDEDGFLYQNFDKELLHLFTEVRFFERLHFQIPHRALEICSHKEKYRLLREEVLNVVRDYNKILEALDDEERRLFYDRITHLDKHISPGLSKVHWTSPSKLQEYFIGEARKHCKNAYESVVQYKEAIGKVTANCAEIASTILVSVVRKKVYAEGEFEEAQKTHREKVTKKFTTAHEEMRKELSRTFKRTFAHDSENVQREWAELRRKIDKRLEDALRTSVKRSLQELSKALNGDKKLDVVPLFSVITMLKNNRRVELTPNVSDLFALIHGASRELIAIVKVVDRLGPESDDDGEPLPSFFDVISNDEDATLKQIVSIDNGINLIVEKTQSFIAYYEKTYKHLWEQDMVAHVKRYAKAKKPLSSFEADITKYKELFVEVEGEDQITNMAFLRIDVGPLKQTLLKRCEEWRDGFTRLLNETAIAELDAVYEYCARNEKILSQPARDLDHLAELVNLHKKCVAEEETAARFAPLRAQYALLARFEVVVRDAELARLDGLEKVFDAHVATLKRMDETLVEAKESFREKLIKTVDAFTHDVDEHRRAFTADAPIDVADAVGRAPLARAKAFIESNAAAAAAFRQTEQDLKAGMEIFGMPAPPLSGLVECEKETAQLSGVWNVIEEWITAYDGWKDGKFKDIDVEELENASQIVGKKIQKLGREVKHWSAWQGVKDTVDAFKRTLPLIIDLRNPAIRQRHWEQLMERCGERFDPHGDAFTLGKVNDLGLSEHADFVGELSTNATKELAIENSLAAIEEGWQDLNMDMVKREGGQKGGKVVYRLRSTDDVFAALEDNVVTLSTMKASKFFLVFEATITSWEQKLSLVSEMMDLVQKVQMSWTYLENIFVGSEDIRKQLPQESKMFDAVNVAFIKNMAEMTEIENVVKACTGSDPKAGTPVSNARLDKFTDMEAKLEKIQKSLEDYLEKKRQQFPRFYFISSDDLLEILGQAKDPMNVQPHFKGMFEGIKKLEMHAPGEDGRRAYGATAMHSPDGETIPFNDEVTTDGRPEEWLNSVETAMYAATKKSLYATLEHSKGMKKEKWVKEYPGQCIISAGCVVWTTECEKALSDPDAAKKAIRTLKKKWVSYLSKLVTMTRSKLDKVNRKKVVALITIEVHARDSIDKLGKAGCTQVTDFEWVSQLRFYWDQTANDCVVKQVLSVFSYGYEYQGNNGRLVVTPLTDRCYMTLGAAMFTRRGGNPLGPAGTGKTETVKDFGKALARYVIVFNCSDGVDYKMTAKMFSGLAQTGAWACLDEFNRISVEVLSVVATQISVIMAAVKVRAKTFFFEGQDIRLIPSCGVFVTMNPGYAGRAELPDNLKAIVRPVSMMVPDFNLIAEIMMFAEGFSSAKVLAKKMVAIMELSQQQLSKQDHYDYTLRSFVIPISRAAGAFKRIDPEGSEEAILYRTMQDLIMPKLVYLDIPLFRALLGDLFPGVDLPQEEDSDLKKMLVRKCDELGLQVVDEWIVKIIQIFDCKVARHGNMIVGKTGAGKTAAWTVLKEAMAELCKEGKGEGEFQKVEVYTINPLALSNDEIYGCFDPSTHEWQDGILARVMRNICKDESQTQKWTLFDGPVDTLWIESMNTLLDDNKLLTLLSGERIMMSPQVSILFEVEDLSQASPATVSRAGMIYLNVEDLGWWPYVTSWMKKYESDEVLSTTLKTMMERCMEDALELRRLQLRELVQTDKLAAVRQFTALFDAHCDPEHGLDPDDESYVNTIELTFFYCLIWSVGASVDGESRKIFDSFLRDVDSRFPPPETVYEYFVCPKNREWTPFASKLAQYRPPPGMPFFKIMVPTIDTLRTKTVALALAGVQRHVLIIGNVGVGKTMVAQVGVASHCSPYDRVRVVNADP